MGSSRTERRRTRTNALVDVGATGQTVSTRPLARWSPERTAGPPRPPSLGSFGALSGNPGKLCPSSGLESTNDKFCGTSGRARPEDRWRSRRSPTLHAKRHGSADGSSIPRGATASRQPASCRASGCGNGFAHIRHSRDRDISARGDDSSRDLQCRRRTNEIDYVGIRSVHSASMTCGRI
jgi:hypothetical protein